jgi:septum formation protein
MKIILGSGSKFRKKILERAGYFFEVRLPHVNERLIRTEDPYQLPLRLAEAKAKNLLTKIFEPALLITCDTVVLSDGIVYEKPESDADVRVFLQDFSRVGYAEILTSIVVTNTKTHKHVSGTDICTVEFDPIPESVVKEFLATGDPYSRAGGFSVEDETLAPYIRVTSGTPDSIMGLPLGLLAELLAKAEQGT